MSKHETSEVSASVTEQTPEQRCSTETTISILTEQLSEALRTIASTPKPIDQLFTIEHQGMISAKYRAKYSDIEQDAHHKQWSEYKGNHFMLYVLAETLLEAKKAVFSANRKILLNSLISAMTNYTPTVPESVLTELQTTFNKVTDMQLSALTDTVPDDSQRAELLKDYAKVLKQGTKVGKDTDNARAKFYHCADALHITPNTIW